MRKRCVVTISSGVFVKTKNDWQMASRIRFAGTHLALSFFVVGLVAILIFGVWYPSPYSSISGGVNLFVILVSVDLFAGPLMTAVVSTPSKSRREWYFDMALVVGLQVAALCYGVWTVAQARPVYLAFEIDRLRVIHATDVPDELLDQAPSGLAKLSWRGPQLVAVRPFRNANEEADATLAALQGLSLAARPDLWMPYEQAISRINDVSKPSILWMASGHPGAAAAIQSEVIKARVPVEQVRVLPLVGRQSFWTALIDQRSGRPFAFLPIDGFEI